MIKKDRDVQIENEIGRIFQGHNVLEYKSPEEHLNIDSFYKAVAYACFAEKGEIKKKRIAKLIYDRKWRELVPEESLFLQGYDNPNENKISNKIVKEIEWEYERYKEPPYTDPVLKE